MKYSKLLQHPSMKTKKFSKELKKIKAIWKKLFWTDYKTDVIYTLPGHALPSQYRTVLPVSNSNVDEESLLKLEKTKRRIRNVTLALTSLLVVIIIVIIALIIALELSIREDAKRRLLLTSSHRVNISKFNQTEIQLLKAQTLVLDTKSAKKSQEMRPQYSGLENKELPGANMGMRCFDRCLEYTAFRFKPVCLNGYCRCQDSNYDDVTCLPRVEGCTIQKHEKHRTFMASHMGSPQPLYACARKTKDDGNSPPIHVISIFGNRRADFTDMHVTSMTEVNVTLVLVSYEPLIWNVKLGNKTNVKTIVLISNHQVSRTQVKVTRLEQNEEFVKDSTEENLRTSDSFSSSSSASSSLSSPSSSFFNSNTELNYKTVRMLTRTGFGDDRVTGSTPTLLNFVSRRLGGFSTFVGTAHADFILYQIEEDGVSTRKAS